MFTKDNVNNHLMQIVPKKYVWAKNAFFEKKKKMIFSLIICIKHSNSSLKQNGLAPNTA